MSFKTILGALILGVLLFTSAFADIPQTINYQGYLTDEQGEPITFIGASVAVKIMNAETGGTTLWSELYPWVEIEDGFFDIILGGGIKGPIPSSVFDGGDRWLEIMVNTGSGLEAIEPRTKLTSVPYTYQSANADMAANAELLDGIDSEDFVLVSELDGHVIDPSAHHEKTTDASELTSGILPTERLPSAVALLDMPQTFTETNTFGDDVQMQGEVTIGTSPNNYNLPNTDGSADQVLSTNGSGTLGWSNQALGGSTFIRWGNSTAPAGTELVMSGYAYAGANSSNFEASIGPVVLAAGDPGAAYGSNPGLVPLSLVYSQFPDGTASTNSFIKAAVCYTDAPTTVIYGTHSAPAGWEVVYEGYLSGPHYSYYNPGGCPICLDTDNFEEETVSGLNSYLYPINVHPSSNISSGGHDEVTYIKCALIKKTQ